jgi:prolyl 4-hydroxylase
MHIHIHIHIQVTHLPERGRYSKQRLSKELLGVMEDWYGDKLELTSIYGVRKYTNESVLRMHVDTANTHVVSAIINVDQEVNTPTTREENRKEGDGDDDGGGDDKDWPLVILDHNGVEHSLIMRPGDLLLYESAKLLHGRPTPLRATSYSNIFIHYMPHDWVVPAGL